MKYQATRNGQFIGEPKNDRAAAQQVIVDDEEHTMACYKQGWITKKQLEENRWYIRKVRR